jgi:hypothetical protein
VATKKSLDDLMYWKQRLEQEFQQMSPTSSANITPVDEGNDAAVHAELRQQAALRPQDSVLKFHHYSKPVVRALTEWFQSNICKTIKRKKGNAKAD